MRVVIASSFADIFRANALKNGLLPVQVSSAELGAITRLVASDPGARFTVDLETETVGLPDGATIAFAVDPFARRMLLDGTDELGYLMGHEDAIAAYEARHPARISTVLPG